MTNRDTSLSAPEIDGQAIRFILASGSKRRRDIMSLAGLTFVVQNGSGGDLEVTSETETDALELTRRNAETKLTAAVKAAHNRIPWSTVVLAADTTVALDGDSLGKPVDRDDAVTMLRRLRARQHEVVTTVAMTYSPHRQHGELLSHAVVSRVNMRDYSDGEIEAYVSTDIPYDRAGAYGVQDASFDPAESVAGCYLNVIGLPMCAVKAMLPEGACTFAHAHVYATCAAHEERGAS